MGNLCEHCSPFTEVQTEFEEWQENGFERAKQIIEQMGKEKPK